MTDYEGVQVEEPIALQEEVAPATEEPVDDAIPTVNLQEVLEQIREIGLKVTVLGAGGFAKIADLAGMAARGVQSAAIRRLRQES